MTDEMQRPIGADNRAFVKQLAAERARAVERDPRLSLVFSKKKCTYEMPPALAPLADTHAHLLSFWGKEPAVVLARAALAGDRMLITLLDPVADGIGAPEFRNCLNGWIAQAHSMLDRALGAGSQASTLLKHVRYLCGVHPYGAPDYTDAVQGQVETALRDPLCIGVGEIGLDYHFDHDDEVAPAPHGVQIACMERQLALAIAHDVPVELHLRNEVGDEVRAAHADAYRVLRRVGIPQAGCVLHCFTEDRSTMERFTGLGCRIAFGGAATFKRNDALREAFAACPLDRLLFETDCPYMAPDPLRGLECEPAMMVQTVDALVHDRARRTGEQAEDIVRAAWNTSISLFGNVHE